MEAGCDMEAGPADRHLMPQSPSFPICAPDTRQEAKIPKPLGLR